MLRWLQKHNNTLYLVSFLLMVISPIPMYFAMRAGQSIWGFILLAVFILGNILLLLVR
jgi:hypothetical protein